MDRPAEDEFGNAGKERRGPVDGQRRVNVDVAGDRRGGTLGVRDGRRHADRIAGQCVGAAAERDRAHRQHREVVCDRHVGRVRRKVEIGQGIPSGRAANPVGRIGDIAAHRARPRVPRRKERESRHDGEKQRDLPHQQTYAAATACVHSRYAPRTAASSRTPRRISHASTAANPSCRPSRGMDVRL